MTDSMFAAPGRFFRGNLHTHSDRSDGVLSAAATLGRSKEVVYLSEIIGRGESVPFDDFGSFKA